MSKSAKAKATKKTAKRAKQQLPPGTTLTREYKGKTIKVVVTETGFRHEGKEYKSLTALAKFLTGYPAVSGPAYFRTATISNGAAK